MNKNLQKLSRSFYGRDSVTVARELLGKVLVHKTGGQELRAIIVETEAYGGIPDKAAHSYGGKKTPRTKIMFGDPGFSYVYLIYGIYNCFNIVVAKEGDPQAVLIRALEPLEGLETMAINRYNKDYKKLSQKQIYGLTNGPGKLCMAMNIDKSLNGEDLSQDTLYLEAGKEEEQKIVEAKRIGIDYAQEAKDYLWRFYLRDNPFVSAK